MGMEEGNGIGHIVKDHSDSEKGNPLTPLHGLHFLISSKGSFIYSTYMIAHITSFVTPVVEHWLEQEKAQWVHHEGLIQMLLSQSYISLPILMGVH